MKIVYDIESIPPLQSPISLTIGNFDGVHLGHQALLAYAKNLGLSVALTFSNHPADIIESRPKAPRIYSLEHKLKLLERHHVDVVILLNFSKELSLETFDQFLTRLKQKLPFDYLIRGKHSTLGKGGAGSEQEVKKLQERLNFKATYLELSQMNQMAVSSGLVRSLIAQGDFKTLKMVLGRPYSVYGSPPFDLKNQILPPEGSYPVTLRSEGQIEERAALIFVEKTSLRLPENFTEKTVEIIF